MKNQKLLKSISGALLFFSGFGLCFAQEAVFTDVPLGARHYVAIKFLKDHEIVDGYSDGKFKPLDNITRVEALKILLNTLFKKPDLAVTGSVDGTLSTARISPLPTFADVTKDAWYYDTVQKALTQKIVNGYPDKLFHPEGLITTAEALKIMLLLENQPLPALPLEKQPYSDVPVDSWISAYAAVSKDRSIVLESRTNGGELVPDYDLTRGEFAQMIYNLLQSSLGDRFGRATYYADSLAGGGTSNGEKYDPNLLTAAHRTLPFGTKLLVTNVANGESVIVTVNDRGPYATGVKLDLSKSAFAAIASVSAGIITVQYKILPQ